MLETSLDNKAKYSEDARNSVWDTHENWLLRNFLEGSNLNVLSLNNETTQQINFFC